MPVTTTSAAIHVTPVVVKTFLAHSKKKAKRLRASKDEHEVPQDDIFFDEAFHIVKAFIEMGTKNTIESLQAFTNTHVPAPYWAAVSPVTIPLSSCNAAADVLIEWFGPQELKHVVGGERWWQVRGLNGIDGEWIAELEDIDSEIEVKVQDGKKLNTEEANILRMEKLDKVMLYVHGGGYFWGSVNTHRYQILHYAHKFKGRAFAVNYRKAPQYPWPCPLQDVIAAYLYLIRPPPGALHKAIPNSKIVFAGDSAGGGLCLTVLTVLRDLGLPMPAGAVLISPWVDLTHSFPSIMKNYDTDIIPKYGFLAKPSTLWPVPTQPESGGRIVPTVINEPPKHGKADTLTTSSGHVEKQQGGVYRAGKLVKSQEEMLVKSESPSSGSQKEAPQYDSQTSSRATPESKDEIEKTLEEHNMDHWEPKPPKILMENPNAVPLEIRSQFQMYAATEQLTHPLVSPILQGSLGNLPPLYIIGGDGEVLRDEIIYLAHKAAHPSKYPTRAGVLRDSVRQKENAEKFTTPTKVHLQIFDGMCHVLTVFMFTKSAKYAYRSIAEFIKHVTSCDEEHLSKNPFPDFHMPLDDILKRSKSVEGKSYQMLRQDTLTNDKQSTPESDLELLYLANEKIAAEAVKQNEVEASPLTSTPSTKAHATEDISGTLMIRDRVDIHGNVRPMEPIEALEALNIQISQIGLIKEAPAQRWRDGQDKWDKRFSKKAKKVVKKKAKYEAKAARLLENALDQGFVHQSHGSLTEHEHLVAKSSASRKTSMGEIQADRRWGPLDLENERPPATAIAGRHDTQEAVALLKKSIYYTAPVTHLTVPKLKAVDAVRAAFNPHDDPNKPPTQSASEQQVKTNLVPIHGLRVWDDIVRYFGRKSIAKAADGISATAEKVGLTNSDEN
ncbi:hypothetical protein BDZ97DRAFT_1653726 [Flammula alnicola]|nr:hypothetical protein BDZ97DRAFT_1653726 [Flammula alnicola]